MSVVCFPLSFFPITQKVKNCFCTETGINRLPVGQGAKVGLPIADKQFPTRAVGCLDLEPVLGGTAVYRLAPEAIRFLNRLCR